MIAPVRTSYGRTAARDSPPRAPTRRARDFREAWRCSADGEKSGPLGRRRFCRAACRPWRQDLRPISLVRLSLLRLSLLGVGSATFTAPPVGHGAKAYLTIPSRSHHQRVHNMRISRPPRRHRGTSTWASSQRMLQDPVRRSCFKWAVPFIPMPMPKPVCRTCSNNQIE